MGMVLLPALGLYLIILFLATCEAYRWAGKRGLPKGKRFLVAIGGFLIIYLPLFWDHIPTLASQQYACRTEAGFWVYKTVDQWKAENPGVMETLVAFNDGRSGGGGYILNQRFNWAVKKNGPLPFNRWRWEHTIVDSKNNNVLARYVDFSTGNGNIGGEPPLRFWLQNGHCSNGESNYGKFIRLKRDVQVGGKK